MRGKYAATLWFLLKAGTIGKIDGLDEVEKDPCVVANIQRLYENTEVLKEWIGNEKQVLTRVYIVCDSKKELCDKLTEFQAKVKVTDTEGNDMLLRGFDPKKALEM